MLKTIHIETGLQLLGGPKQVIHLVKGLQERGHTAQLVCTAGSGVHQEAIRLKLDPIPIQFSRDMDLTIIPKLVRIIRREQPDIVHLHSRRGADLYGGIAARLAHAPAIISSRRIDNPIRGLISTLKFGPLCDRIISISDGVTRALLAGGIPPEKVSLVHSVLDIRDFNVARKPGLRAELGVPPDALLLGIIAQLIPRKGHQYLFQAMPGVLRRFPNTVLLVLGQGAMLPKLQKEAARLGIAQQVVFTGFRSDIPQVLREIDVVVHPALMEGLGIAILQTLASRVPVIATPVGGIPDVVKDEVNGLMVPPKDAAAIEHALIRLLGDPALRQRLGENGRSTVETEFSLDSMVEGVLAVYHDVLDQRGRMCNSPLGKHSGPTQ